MIACIFTFAYTSVGELSPASRTLLAERATWRRGRTDPVKKDVDVSFSRSARLIVRMQSASTVVLALLLATTVHAQSTVNGKALYNAILVTGEKSCGNGACHGPDPTVNQNKIKNGTAQPLLLRRSIPIST